MLISARIFIQGAKNMKITNKINQAIQQISTQKPNYEGRDPTFTLKVDPDDKALLAFIFRLASGNVAGHYSHMDTGIKSSAFSYELQGKNDELKLIINYKWFEYSKGCNLHDYITKLISAINQLTQEISTGWTQKKNTSTGNAYYGNATIYGTYYEFLLVQIARHLNANTLKFSTWLPHSCWTMAEEITVAGKNELVNRFIEDIAAEFANPISLEEKEQKALDSEIPFDLKIHEGGAQLTFSNTIVHQPIKISLTTSAKGVTFIHQLTSQNLQNATARRNAKSKDEEELEKDSNFSLN